MWDWLINLLKSAASYLAAFFAGQMYQEKKQAEETAEKYKNAAQDFANQPLTDDDFEQRMRARIKRKRDT